MGYIWVIGVNEVSAVADGSFFSMGNKLPMLPGLGHYSVKRTT